MNRRRQAIAVFLSLAMVFTLTPWTFAASGEDSSHWAKGSFDRWAGYGVLKGDENGNANLDANMTRGEFAQTLSARCV